MPPPPPPPPSGHRTFIQCLIHVDAASCVVSTLRAYLEVDDGMRAFEDNNVDTFCCYRISVKHQFAHQCYDRPSLSKWINISFYQVYDIMSETTLILFLSNTHVQGVVCTWNWLIDSVLKVCYNNKDEPLSSFMAKSEPWNCLQLFNYATSVTFLQTFLPAFCMIICFEIKIKID